jgi:hypothetical protein
MKSLMKGYGRENRLGYTGLEETGDDNFRIGTDIQSPGAGDDGKVTE